MAALKRIRSSSPSRTAMDVVAPRTVRQSSPVTRRRSRFAIGLYIRRYRTPLLICLMAVAVLAGLAIGHIAPWARADPVTELRQVEQEVGQHYLLPQDEQPVLATVQDESQLSSPFLKQAKNGDKILIYTKARVVIIYRPSIDRIVAVGPVQINGSDSSN